MIFFYADRRVCGRNTSARLREARYRTHIYVCGHSIDRGPGGKLHEAM